MNVKLYIDTIQTPGVDNYEQLDLFKDEKIEFTRKLVNIDKLSNIFNDFTSSFSIPATPKNNRILKHYYDSDMRDSINANTRYLSLIEIDTYPIKYGKIQLENVILKGGVPSSYKLTFYGVVIQLTDLFGSDTIDKLDDRKNADGTVAQSISDPTNALYTSSMAYKFDYVNNSGNFVNSLNLSTFKNGDLFTPLIVTANRDININSPSAGVASSDVTTTGGAFNYEELRPCIRMIKILEAIELKYGITFSRDFFSKATFMDLFMWMNNAEKYGEEQFGDGLSVVFSSAPTHFLIGPAVGDAVPINDTIKLDPQYIQGNTNTVIFIKVIPQGGDTAKLYQVEIFYFDTDADGNETEKRVLLSPPLKGTQIIATFPLSMGGVNNKTRFKISCTQTFGYSTQITAREYQYNTSVANTTITNATQNVFSLIRYSSNIQKMKVIEFLQGIIQMFKLVIVPTSNRSFYVDTLNNYLAKGTVHDITNYVDHKTLTIERPFIYKNIMLKYQKSDTVLGKAYRMRNESVGDEWGYGDLKYELPTIESKEELKVELPFENMLFERQDLLTSKDTKFCLGMASQLDANLIDVKKIKTKPIIFYDNGIVNPFATTADYLYFAYAGATSSCAYTHLIGSSNDEILEQVTDSVNFNSDNDGYHQALINNSLFENYWQAWIENIYDLKQRKVSYSAFLPAIITEQLELNDALIIGDKRYRINDFVIDLTTGATKLNLYNDVNYTTLDTSSPTIAIIKTSGNVDTLVYADSVICNAGYKHYDIKISCNHPWVATKLDTGDGITWYNIIHTSESGITIKIEEKASQVPPDVYLSRSSQIRFQTVINGFAHSIYYDITQNGLAVL